MKPSFLLNAPVRRGCWLLAFALALLGQSGCSFLPTPSPDPTRYYVLTGAPLADAATREHSDSLVIGIKRIEIAPYLDGKDMVVRAAGNEISYQSFARWAEPLTTSITRTVAGRLAGSEKVARVYPQPFPFDVERDYDVSIRVLRCEGERKKNGNTVASFTAVVEVTEAGAGGTLIMRKVFVGPETPWNGRDFGKLAQALSDEVGALSAEVIAALPAK